MNERGVIVGCDQNLEWLLPWFFENYSTHNTTPITFFDFGMSEYGKNFCKMHGRYLSLETLKEKHKCFSELSDEDLGQFSITHPLDYMKICHKAWMKKPLACLYTPYETTIWIDIDCKVRKNIDGLFDLLAPESQICLSLDHPYTTHLKKITGIIKEEEVQFSSGAMIFRKNASFIRFWIETISKKFYPGDQEALSDVINGESIPYKVLEKKYHLTNWEEITIDAFILHYGGPQGKIKLIKEILEKKPPLEETAPQKDSV